MPGVQELVSSYVLVAGLVFMSSPITNDFAVLLGLREAQVEQYFLLQSVEKAVTETDCGCPLSEVKHR